MTFVEDENLVELVENTFTGLVERDKGGLAHDVSKKSKRLGVIESRGSIETSSRVVPGADSGARTEHFGDGDTLSFTTGNTSNKGIADLYTTLIFL